MIKLNAVNTLIDTKTTMVYPQNSDGTPDLNCGGYLEDCCEEWFDCLSKEDRKIVNEYK